MPEMEYKILLDDVFRNFSVAGVYVLFLKYELFSRLFLNKSLEFSKNKASNILQTHSNIYISGQF